MSRLLHWARTRDERGAATAEFAMVAPLLVLFLIASLQVGLVVIGNSAATNAAREGARSASIRYECADGNTGTQCTTSPTTNLATITSAVMAKLNGLVKTSTVTVTVKCLKSDLTTQENCDRNVVKLDTDVVEVTVKYRHVGATPYVFDNLHTVVARSVIVGAPIVP